MKALITGGAGFIGSAVAERLLQRGDAVCVIDDLSTGSEANISRLRSNKLFSFCKGNILDYKLMLQLMGDADCVYHFAAAVGVKYVTDYPLESLITNVRGTEIVLELAHVFKRKIFIASSSEVYGKSGKAPFRENDDRVLGSVTIPRWGYSCSKALDEFLAIAYHAKHGLPVVIGRLFNVCGPRQRSEYGMVIPRFCKQAAANEPISVYGDGSQVRSFTYISDTVEAIVSLMASTKAIGAIVNIGSRNQITMMELAEKIKQLTGSGSEIVRIPYQRAYGDAFEDMQYRVPDISRLEELVGFVPQVSLDEMLTRIIAAGRRP